MASVCIEKRISKSEQGERFTYLDLLHREKEILQLLIADPHHPPFILLTEVSPTITSGSKKTPEDFLWSEEEFKEKGIEKVETGRGGRVTYHGPGQWVLFILGRMENLVGDSKGVRKAVLGLLSIGASVGRKYRKEVRAVETGPELGVWSDQGKFCALGIRVTQGILTHGISINGYRTQESFSGIKPCGLDKKVDYLIDREDRVAFDQLGEEILQTVLEKSAFSSSF